MNLVPSVQLFSFILLLYLNFKNSLLNCSLSCTTLKLLKQLEAYQGRGWGHLYISKEL